MMQQMSCLQISLLTSWLLLMSSQGFAKSAREGEIDLTSVEKRTNTEFVSHQGAPEGYPEPPTFRISRQPAIPGENGSYYYASIFCDPKNPKVQECQPYIAKLKLGYTAIIKEALAKIEIPLRAGKEVEHYSFQPLLLRDIDQDGRQDLVVQFRIQFNPVPAFGSAFDDYVAFVKLPEFTLLYWGNAGHQGDAGTGLGWKTTYVQAYPGIHAPIVMKQKCQGTYCGAADKVEQKVLCWDDKLTGYKEGTCSLQAPMLPAPEPARTMQGPPTQSASVQPVGPSSPAGVPSVVDRQGEFPGWNRKTRLFVGIAVLAAILLGLLLRRALRTSTNPPQA